MLTLIEGHARDLGGGFTVARLLPAVARRTVGPFVFLDHFGPVVRQPGEAFDVRPHPHIGLCTVTYLFEGAMIHRDSVGSVQRIEPGAINWMTAGRGIVHSERTPEELRPVAHRMHGLQMWVGLPVALEECEPSFVHTPASHIPTLTVGDASVRVLVGGLGDHLSPVRPASPTLFLHLSLPENGTVTLPSLAREFAIYPLDGDVDVDGTVVASRRLAVVDSPGAAVTLRSTAAVNVAIVGGDPLDGPRHLSWNFVSHDKARVEAAARDWEARRFSGIAGETEFIPLPDYLRPA